MQDDKNKAETVLFTTGRFLNLDEISKLSGIGSVGYLKELLDGLKKDYETRNGALEIISQGEKWKINIRKEYLHLTENLLTDAELDRPTQETLAVIAYKHPAQQHEIIKIRGNKAYDHIGILKELDFVTSEPSGRSRLLKLTQKFYDYFDVVADQLQAKLKEAENKEVSIEQKEVKTEENSANETAEENQEQQNEPVQENQ